MGIISRMRKQNAIYWPPATADDYGRPAHGTLVELILVPGGVNRRVRWEGKNEEFVDASGTTALSNAVVYVPAIPGGEIKTGGFLWLGDRASLTDEAVPGNNTGAHEVRRFDTMPNFKATETLRTVYL